MLDRLDTLKGTPKQQIYSSRGFPRGYWQTYSNPLMPKDMKTPSKKQSTPPSLSSCSMPSSPPSEATIRPATLEAEGTCLHASRRFPGGMHRIVHSSPKVEGEDGTVANDSDKEEGDKDNSDPSTTPPTHRDG